MKARIRKTGEIVEVFRNKHNVYIDEEHRGYSAGALDFIFEDEQHWQDVRERAAIAAMQSLIYKSQYCQLFAQSIAIDAVEYADALVEQLKKE